MKNDIYFNPEFLFSYCCIYLHFLGVGCQGVVQTGCQVVREEAFWELREALCPTNEGTGLGVCLLSPVCVSQGLLGSLFVQSSSMFLLSVFSTAFLSGVSETPSCFLKTLDNV